MSAGAIPTLTSRQTCMHLVRVDDAPTLAQLGSHIQTAATHLRQVVADPVGRTQLIATINELRTDTEGFIHDLAQRLDRTVGGTINREDVATLSFHVGNVIELIDGTSRRIITFGIREPNARAIELCEVLVRATTQIASAIDDLASPHRVLLDLASVRELEDEGDRIYGAAVGKLFADSPDGLVVLEVLKWKELFDRLADAIDECNRAARVLRRVAMSRA
jgi:uncharacterized protein